MTTRGTLLIVDDETEILRLLCGLLREDGFTVFSADSGAKALGILSRDVIDVMITDIRMPGMDGIELIRKRNNIEPAIETLIIVITGHGDISTAIEAMKLGAINYLRKPINFEELEVAITLALEKLDLIKRIKQKQAKLEKATIMAEAANRAKSQFLANMSHEIRTPMNAIIGMNRLALEDGGSQEQRQYLLTVQNSAENLLLLLNDILDFSKIEADKIELVNNEFNLSKLLDESCSVQQLKVQETGLELGYYKDPALPENVFGDAARVRQVLLNLLANAVKFTRTGHIFLSVKLEKEENDKCIIHFAVEDTGIGIAKDRCEEIFNSFTQADSSISRKYGGTGLGLAISKELVALMGGTLQVESRENYGSLFSFSLPFGKRKTLFADTVFRKEDQIRPVLLAFSSSLHKKIISKYLGLYGFTVQIVPEGEEIVETLSACNTHSFPSLLVLEHQPPEHDSISVIEQIRGNSVCSSIPIIVVRNLGDNKICRKCYGLRLTSCLRLPVNEQQLKNAVVAALKGDFCSQRIKSNPNKVKSLFQVSKLRILLVEDNLVNQNLAVIFLQKNGCQVIVAANGLEALELMCHEDVDLILMDVQMPVMDGLTAVRYIRECEKTTLLEPDTPYYTLRQRLATKIKGQHVPIVAMTAHGMAGDRELCLGVGMDDYLIKPFEPATVLSLLSGIADTLSGAKDYAISGFDKNIEEAVLDEKYREEDSSGKKSMSVARSHLQNVYRLDEKQIENLLKISVKSISSTLDNADAACRINDLSELSKAAHKLKGNILSLGLTDLGGLAKKIEMAAKAGTDMDYEAFLLKLRKNLLE